MQHIVHIFVGDRLGAFRDRFASVFRDLHPDVEPSLFTALSCTPDIDGDLSLTADELGDSRDTASIPGDNLAAGLGNYLDALYGRKVTVAHPGNRSLVVMLWVRLFDEGDLMWVRLLTDAVTASPANITVEVTGFTHDAVGCFVTDMALREAPEVYRRHFDDNLAELLAMRTSLGGLRLVTDRNMDNVALGFDHEALVRVCAEYAATLCTHYLTLHQPVSDTMLYPCESFGISSLIFDRRYYHRYIRSRAIADKLLVERIDRRSFDINSLARHSDPLLRDTLDRIRRFYATRALDERARLILENGGATATDIAAQITGGLDEVADDLRARVDSLLHGGGMSVFESEALLALMLGEDCDMFRTSAVKAGELIIDDVLDDSARFFQSLDPDHKILQDISLAQIKDVRSRMRNLAVANRQYTDQLADLAANTAEEQAVQRHIEGKQYRFDGVEYKVDLVIDNDPLEETYVAHPVTETSVDLRDLFGPVRSQGSQGCCSAFAVASVIEAMRRDKQRYSPAFLYWSAREADNCTGTDCGTTLYKILRGARDKGDCPEAMMPYSPGTFDVAPSAEATETAMDCRVVEAKTVNPEVGDIKSALADGYPVIVAAQIFNSFSDTRSGFVPHPSADELYNGTRDDGHGRHALVICGFSDKERVLVARNSWGTGFGDKGYCYIPYSYADKYFLQACIITAVTPAGDVRPDLRPARRLDFNTGDTGIQIAILRNLIAENDDELTRLAAQSTALRTRWAQNIAVLGNVNNQQTLLEQRKQQIGDEIKSLRDAIDAERMSMEARLAAYARASVVPCLIAPFFALCSGIVLYYFPTSTLWWIIFALALVLSLIIIPIYIYRYKQLRQELRDHIQDLAEQLGRKQLELEALDIQAHIHGTILRLFGKYQLDLQRDYRRLRSFNADIVALYDDTVAALATMTPAVPYPFLAVLDNDRLDRYYEIWKARILGGFDIRDWLRDYNADDGLRSTVDADGRLRDAVDRGLRDFTMRQYLHRDRPDKYQFLPDKTDPGTLLPELDARALPFCPYNSERNSVMEKYLFVPGLTTAEMAVISRHFAQQPMPVATDSPYTVSVLNITRYPLPAGHSG